MAAHAEAAVALRQELHATPELGHAELATAARVAAALGDGVAPGPGTAVIAETGPAGPLVAVRAELDGLPLRERTGVGWACGDGRMHACGHDVHMAAAAALWWAARDLGERLPLRLRLVFQPAEELYPSGALELVERGCLRDADAVVAAHVHPEIPDAEVALDAGPVNAACANFAVTIAGRGGHAAYPERAVDPVPALGELLSAIARLSREAADGIVGVGAVESGGSENVIPERALVRGTVRGRTVEVRSALLEALGEVARTCAAAHGCSAELRVHEGEPALVNDAAIVEAGRRLLDAAGLRAAAPWRSYGADDFAYYGSVAPTAMAFVGLRGMPGFAERPLHHPEFLPPDAAVGRVATVLACLAFAAAG